MANAYRKSKEKPIVIDWRPDRDLTVPVYSQIVDYFSEQIFRGNWMGGQVLPSQRRLAELFGVNRSTIVEAMCELTAMGLLEGHYGGGTQIASDSWTTMIQPKTPDWQNYIRAGHFRSNLPTVQAINYLEFQEGIVRMSTGEFSPDLMPAGLVKQALAGLSRRKLYLNYPDPLGLPEMRAAVQGYLGQRGIDVSASCILITSGALQALQLISNGIVRTRSTIYMESPSYLNSLNIFQTAGAVLEGVPMDEDGPCPWMIRYHQNIPSHSLLYTIPTFQNPTGRVMPEARRQEILRFCAKNHMPIIEDDVFCDLWLDEAPPPPIKALDKNGVVLYVGSVSKCFSPGLRVGWLVGPEPVVERLADIKMQVDYGVSALSQQVAAELLNSGLYGQGTREVREQLRRRRSLMLELLERHFTGLAQWTVPAGGFFIWIQLKNRVSAERVFRAALKQGLLVPPGSMYGAGFASCLRLTFGYLSEEEMASSMSRLADIVRSLRT